MHGLIFASLQDFSVERFGEEQAAEIWADRIFEPTQAYDDEWFAAQLERIAAAAGQSRDATEREFGSFAAQQTFARLFPDYYAANDGAVPFLLGIEEKIHELVRATIEGATPPKLHVQPFQQLGVLVSYTSDRRLCRLLEGLVAGTGAHYGEQLAIEEIQCMHRGDPGCVFTVVGAAAKRPVTRAGVEPLPRGANASPAPVGRNRGT